MRDGVHFDESDLPRIGTRVEVDTVRHAELTQKYGVFRIPYWVGLDAAGRKVYTKSGVLSLADLNAAAGKLK